MIENFKNHLLRHIQGNKYLYILIVFFFILGVAAGSYVVELLNSQQVSELINYLDKFFSGFAQWNVDPSLIVQRTIINNLKIILFFWCLGLTVIGVPLILLIISFRGFVMGFTIGFLYNQKSIYGLIIALLAIVPPSIIYLPATIIGAAVAITFSYWLIRGRSRGMNGSILQQFIAYNFIMLVISIFAALAGIIEAYLSPTFIKIFSNFVSL
ncbi:MAG: Required for dissolution of the septal cell wall [Clostridia bacterium 41_269]|nr:MAG: Required for dissolution of the septal cell wall [Clostridia bacterium 41_269]